MNRSQNIERIRQHPQVSVLIIGAGINGIGTYRELALQGVDVLLVDRGDFCSGASAASSHMVHGGIRYLENGEFRLVREAVHERNRLIAHAPHYVKPLPTVIPIFKWLSGILNAPLKFLGWLDRPAERGFLVIKIGLMLYDAYTKDMGTVPKHKIMWRKESLQHYPKLNPEIICTATYYDGAMPSPERICIDLLKDVEEAGAPAHAINYMSAVGAHDGKVVLHDEINGETLEVEPTIVINAAGPWIDFANEALGKKTKFIGGTKGSHLVLNHPELREAIAEEEFFFENKDGRIVLIFPLLDKVLIGTSDIFIENPDDARCTDEEIDYFLGMIAKVFPSIQVGREHIVFQFSGVRPLPVADAKRAGQVSRDHSIKAVEAGNGLDFPVLSLVGGKWTTFRAFSEQVADEVLGRLQRERIISTRDMDIGGGRGYPTTDEARKRWLAAIHERTGVPAERLDILLERYGTRAADVAAFIAEGEDEPLQTRPDYSQREITYLAQHEMIMHLDDLLLRRSLLAMLGELTYDLVVELAQVLGKALEWTEEHVQSELERTIALMADHHGVHLTA
ncbi:MAG: glycerol-3-phosphate dehydrogenase/oxidase [Chloroflexi bacterium]|nr:glycerol-3-phosphate dehydrogenase/oxidase [Chloroflexota bacterium]